MNSMMDMHNKIHTVVDHKFRHALLPSETEPKEFSVQALREAKLGALAAATKPSMGTSSTAVPQ
jgi:hypothetical protein